MKHTIRKMLKRTVHTLLLCICATGTISMFFLWYQELPSLSKDDIGFTKSQDSESVYNIKHQRWKNKDTQLANSGYERGIGYNELQSRHDLAADGIIIRHNDYPTNNLVIKHVHYLWCGKDTFDFRHYMCIKSAIKILDPERLTFWYSRLPVDHKHNYNSWFQELVDTVPFLELHNISSAPNRATSENVCKNETQTKWFVFHRIIKIYGGVFIGEESLITQFPMALWDTDLLNMYSSQMDALVIGKIDVHDTLLSLPAKGQCVHDIGETFENNQYNLSNTLCFHLSDVSNPTSIWNKRDPISKLMNYLMYDTTVTPTPLADISDPIPNIGHILWLRGKHINYLFYLSALSLLYIVKVDILYIHGDAEPKGEYWDLLKNKNNVKFIYRSLPSIAFTKLSRSSHHMSDIFRAEIMFKYGGIYTDVDVIWTQPINKQLRSYSAVASYDWAHNYLFYPNYINLGVTLGKPGAEFWRLYRDSLKDFRDDTFGYNGLLMPYKIHERHPGSILIEPHLQVMCFRVECYPTWREATNWRTFNWTTATYAFHWTYPDPKEFSDRSTLLNTKSVWADIARHVLKAAGEL